MKKQISDEATILACFKYFLSCSKAYFIRTKEAKVAGSDLAIDFI